MGFDEVAEAIKKYHPNPDLDLVKQAYDFSQSSHQGQVRASGEPYFNHVHSTALIVCELKLDISSVIAALLHDTIEDCNVTKAQIQERFGKDVAEIVEGVTNLTRLEFETVEHHQAESFRKMLLAMAKDIRVILVKLADRLHNMRTLHFLPEAKQRRKAIETKEIYAPLANRLGIHWLKSELEDLSFMYLRPTLYQQVRDSFARSQEGRDAFIDSTTREIVKLLEDAGVAAAVKGRSKHFFSIWQKMERNNLSFEEIHDLLGFRIVVPTVRACYETLGIIHSAWKPVPGRFKDYIAMSKPNMYQSLHTTVIGPAGERIEIQIRTPEMNKVAEEGIAAHWRYKEGGSNQGFDLQWVRELVETQQYLVNPDEFMQSVKGELFPEDVFVFTPKGDLIRLPFQSTPVDFAYAVHTDIGHRTSGAKVNGLIVPLSFALSNGDTVEVLTDKNHVPSKDWLNSVRSTKAKQKIRAFVKSEEQTKARKLGEELLAKDLRRVKLSIKKMEKDGQLGKLAAELGYKSDQDMIAEVGYGKLSTTKIISKALPEESDVEAKLKRKTSPLQRIFQRAARASRQKVGVKVSGLDDILVRFAKCCEPLPGDRIIGFITRGRGVVVHHADCAQAYGMDPQRRVYVDWDVDIKSARRVHLTVNAQDQRGLLASVSKAITDKGGDIKSAQIKTDEFNKARIVFELELLDSLQLKNITRAIEMVPGVIKVERIRQMNSGDNVEDLG